MTRAADGHELGETCPACDSTECVSDTYTGAMGHMYGYSLCAGCGYMEGPEIISHAYAVSS